MTDHAETYRRVLEQLDVPGMIALHKATMPHLPTLTDEAEVLASIHVARTMARSLPARLRCYSHRWLSERGYPSGLPDEMKPMADRMFPKVASAVGISVNARSELFRPVVPFVRRAMEGAVLEADADGKLLDTDHVSRRMKAAKERAIRDLLGIRVN